MANSHSTPSEETRAITDPVVVLGFLLKALGVLHTKMDERSVAADATRKKDEPDKLGQSVTVLECAIEAMRNAVSYLPAASPPGAVIQVMLASIAIEQASMDPELADIISVEAYVERAGRHIEAALPMLAEALGVDLRSFEPEYRAVMLPDVLREAYISEIRGWLPNAV